VKNDIYHFSQLLLYKKNMYFCRHAPKNTANKPFILDFVEGLVCHLNHILTKLAEIASFCNILTRIYAFMHLNHAYLIKNYNFVRRVRTMVCSALTISYIKDKIYTE